MDVTDEPGAPQLPVRPVVIGLPGRCRVTAVTFEYSDWTTVKRAAAPNACQKQRVLADTSATDGFTAPNPRVYSKRYPDAPAQWPGTSFSRESTLVQVLVCPVRYEGSGAGLSLCRGVRVRVEYEPGQGISPHIDVHGAFEDGFLFLSLNSGEKGWGDRAPARVAVGDLDAPSMIYKHVLE